MIAYMLRRLAQSLIVIFGVTVIVFVIVHLLPGGPRPCWGRGQPRDGHAVYVANGYNRPPAVQFGSTSAACSRRPRLFLHYNEPVSR